MLSKAFASALLLLPSFVTGAYLVRADQQAPLQTSLTMVETGPFRIHPSSFPDKCFDVRGGIFGNGSPVQIYECNGSPSQAWVFDYEIDRIRLAGMDWCLDAGNPPFVNGAKVKIWGCTSRIDAQSWRWYSFGKTGLVGINLADTNLCLDLTEGKVDNGTLIQLWTCDHLNGKNQALFTAL
ncbi:hypothetical protein FA15DRAFT_759106 [Coprinopsis marcescibilis]|uniref:Ricin B lectin domain-containing protein n=1 Tax=Coprinopsis marcescibilis TaxID=230819 RepID=A0A5C3KLM2_COPMA|nr:hypothetical protein FA15DRAFT_759106 [Coprinopsis marcescibilis]